MNYTLCFFVSQVLGTLLPAVAEALGLSQDVVVSAGRYECTILMIGTIHIEAGAYMGMASGQVE